MKPAAIALLVLVAAGCKDNGNNNGSQYRIGAPCSPNGTCPPGQTCISGNVCSLGCSTPGPGMGGNSQCSSNCGNNPSGCMFSCDIDLFCKQGCNPNGGSCTPGSCTGGNQICDSSFNVCRQRCGGGGADGGGGCPSGQECFNDPQNQGCPYCRPRGVAGTFGQPCANGNMCFNNGGSMLTCDSVSHTCLYNCGMGPMNCGVGPTCPSGYGCDTQGNICRPLCTAGNCPSGTNGVCVTSGSCSICRGTPSNTDGGTNSPTTLATTPGANHLVIDAVNVYWTTNNDIRRCAIGGCMNQPDQVAVGGNPVGITLASGQLYWNSNGVAIYSCPATGTCGSPTPIGQSSEPGGGAIAVGNGKILWSTGSHIYQCPQSGCGGPPTSIDMPSVSPQWIAFDNSNLNFYLGDGVDLYTYGGALSRTSLGAGTIVGITVDINEVFWTTRNNQVKHCTVSGCNDNPDILVNGGGNLQGIAVDSQSIYWTDIMQGKVMKCVRANCGGSTTPAITGQNQPVDVAVDNTNIYWTNLGDGTVKKMPK
jgi:hypothetical protein